MQTQYTVLVYRIDLYFHDYKLEIAIVENEHSDRLSVLLAQVKARNNSIKLKTKSSK